MLYKYKYMKELVSLWNTEQIPFECFFYIAVMVSVVRYPPPSECLLPSKQREFWEILFVVWEVKGGTDTDCNDTGVICQKRRGAKFICILIEQTQFWSFSTGLTQKQEMTLNVLIAAWLCKKVTVIDFMKGTPAVTAAG